jgi:hypothetical protein
VEVWVFSRTKVLYVEPTGSQVGPSADSEVQK